MRNLGGAVGLALINTLLNKRMDLHLERLRESVTWGRRDATDTLAEHDRGAGRRAARTPNSPRRRQLALIVRRQAEVMALSDVFLALTVVFLGCVTLAALHAQARGGRRRGRRALEATAWIVSAASRIGSAAAESDAPCRLGALPPRKMKNAPGLFNLMRQSRRPAPGRLNLSGASVDEHFAAGHEAAFVGGQKERDVRHFGRITEASERRRRAHEPDHVLVGGFRRRQPMPAGGRGGAGASTLTRILRGARSRIQLRAKLRMAALLAL